MLLWVVFLFGVVAGCAVMVILYHYHILAQLRTWGVDWRARAASAEQEVENWKAWAKIKGITRGY